jgi:hypothetical protein
MYEDADGQEQLYQYEHAILNDDKDNIRKQSAGEQEKEKRNRILIVYQE